MQPNFAIKPDERSVSEDFPVDSWDEDQVAAKEAERLDRLVAFGGMLAKQRDEWIAARAATGWDKRVQEDLDQYEGRDTANRMAAEMMNSVEQGYPVTTQHARATRSTVIVNITRPKTNASEARVADILLPTDEENWSIAPTPNPNVVKHQNDDQTPAVDPATGQPIVDPETGEPAKLKDVAAAAMKAAREASEAMTREIKDQLVECDYNAEVRKVIHDSAKMGVGVLKGPVVHSRTKRSWSKLDNGVYALQTVEEQKPASWRVDPRNVWEDPACGDNIQNGKGIYERDIMTAKKLRELAKQPGYLPDQIARVLTQGPALSIARTSTQDKREQLQMSSRPFEVWTYTGEIDIDDFKVALPRDAAGQTTDVPASSSAEDGATPRHLAGEGEQEATASELHKLESVSACIVMVNNVVIKAYENPNESGELPYDFFPWELEVDSPRGVGIPYLLRSQQKVVTAGWRMLMDNAGAAVGPQIIVKKNMVVPADGKWQIAARKLWYATDDVDDVNKAMAVIEFDIHQEQLMAIIQAGEAMADTETGTPMLTQGEEGSAPETLGGMQLLMNNTNVVTRRIVKQFDDKLTKPHIRRYYDFNMAYSDKDEIKGDMDVDARGSSALLVRDIQNQAFTNLLAAGGNPIYAPFINPKKLFEKALQAQHVQPQDIMWTDEEFKANQKKMAENPPPKDPRIEAATITAQARVKEAEQRAETQGAILSARMEEMMMERELRILRMAQERNMTFDQIKAELAGTAMKLRTQRDLAENETQLRLTTGAGI